MLINISGIPSHEKQIILVRFRKLSNTLDITKLLIYMKAFQKITCVADIEGERRFNFSFLQMYVWM